MGDHGNHGNAAGNGTSMKAWTVMVYLAADSVLTNFAIESLKQMKASQDHLINIVAEFDSSPSQSTERYFFGESLDPDPGKRKKMEDPLTSISNNIVMRLDAQDVGDPETLTNFIEWAVQKYPADHYFLIIWGHGSGIDDSFPKISGSALRDALERDQFERFFIPRHRPLNATNLDPADPEVKSVVFVDRPMSYLTNLGLKKALKTAQGRLNNWPTTSEWKLDLLGMDACNMNLIELGYELREFAHYMIASQDEIPDASWPYYHILQDLIKEVKHQRSTPRPLSMPAFVRKIAQAYTGAYQDYVDQPVALSALNLNNMKDVQGLFEPLTDILQQHSIDREISEAIAYARRRVRSFYTHLPDTRALHTRDIYIDLVHFCKLLCSFLVGHEKLPIIENFIAKVQAAPSNNLIAVTESSRNEEECNGTSIYFPANPEDEFGEFYSKLEFAHATVWPAFVSGFLKRNPDLLIPPKFDWKGDHVKSRFDDSMTKGNPNDVTKGNPNDGTKRSHRIVVPGSPPLMATHNPEETINPAIYNVIYNYGTIVEMGSDEDTGG